MLVVVSERLLQAAHDGDAQALNQVIIQCRPNLRRYAARYCAGADVDDAVQEALIIVSRKLPALRSLAAFTGWIYLIARRECRRLARRMRDHAVAPEELEERAWERSSSDTEMRIDLAAAISSLPERYREIIILRDFEELTVREIAQRMNMPPDTVKTRIYRGRHLIREHLMA
ncbi:MAG: RNA polymerase sigma factor [Armatimonadetes bacterium]|nr:RNA polymerase sigma factor [Armatimonadota bacterium]MDE2207865.1 RNA polymerase sigma factor [Armatimonadota bacterium]